MQEGGKEDGSVIFMRDMMHLLWHARASTGMIVGGKKLGEVTGADMRECMDRVIGNRRGDFRMGKADMRLLIAAVCRKALEIIGE